MLVINSPTNFAVSVWAMLQIIFIIFASIVIDSEADCIGYQDRGTSQLSMRAFLIVSLVVALLNLLFLISGRLVSVCSLYILHTNSILGLFAFIWGITGAIFYDPGCNNDSFFSVVVLLAIIDMFFIAFQ